MDCALSSITYKLCSSVICITASISQDWPYKCTGTIALVFGVMALRKPFISILNVRLSTSTKTGFRRNNATTSVVAM